MSVFMLKCGVGYGQSMTSTEVQKQNITGVQIREAVPFSHTSSNFPVNAHVCIEVSQKDTGVSHRNLMQDLVVLRWGLASIPTIAQGLTPRATPEKKNRVQPQEFGPSANAVHGYEPHQI